MAGGLLALFKRAREAGRAVAPVESEPARQPAGENVGASGVVLPAPASTTAFSPTQ
jgi:hypothetical protein